MKVTEHVIVTERKRHPNDVRYPCRGSHEVLDAGRKLITFLHNDDPSQLDLLKEGKLIIDEEETAELYDSFEEKDVIGLGIFRPTGHPNAGFTSNMYTIEKIHVDEDYMDCRNMRSAEIEEISFQDVSVALALGLAEILYRDEKPYGISNEQEWKILLPDAEDEEDSSTSVSGSVGSQAKPVATQPASTPSVEDEVDAMKEAVTDMFGDLGADMNFDGNEKFSKGNWTRGRKLDFDEVVSLNEDDVVWVHYTDEYGKTTQDGPLQLQGKSVTPSFTEYGFGDDSSFVFPVPVQKENWMEGSKSFDNCGHTATIYEAIAKTSEVEETVENMSVEELEAVLAEKLDPKYWSKRRKLSYLQIETLELGDVVWVHATTNLGQVMKKGPLAVTNIDGSVHTFSDAEGEEHVIDTVEDWDDYAEHFMSGGGFYNLFEARDSRPKPESKASANDDTEKLIKAMGLDKKAEEQAKKAEEEAKKEKPLRWSDCYYAFGWNEENYCLVVCSKKHWDEHGTLPEESKVEHLAEQVNLKEISPGVYDYTEAYNQTSLRMLFKAFACEEKPELADTL